MAKKSDGFNVTAAVREYRGTHPGGSARDAFEAIQRAHPKEKLNETSLKTTFYKLAGGGKRKTVKRRKPGRIVAGGVVGIENHVLAVIRAAKELIALTGDSEAAKAVIDHM